MVALVLVVVGDIGAGLALRALLGFRPWRPAVKALPNDVRTGDSPHVTSDPAFTYY